jgi:nucleoside-diphosphate kinase
MNIKNQKTLLIIKPDGMERNLVGEILSRMERVGLKIIDAKMVEVDKELASAHYPVTDEWLVSVGNKSLGDYEKFGLDPIEYVGSNDPKKIGEMIHGFNIEYLMSGKVLAFILEGDHAVEICRKLVGSTVALMAPAGTIRGDFATDSAVLANSEKRSIRNLVHASGTPEEAEAEIKLWFGK